MPRSFRLPDLGEGVTEGRIVEWLVSEGDTVAEDDELVEVETDKAVVVIPSPYSGTIARIAQPAGETVKVGEVLVEFEGAAAEDDTSESSGAAARSERAPAPSVVVARSRPAIGPDHHGQALPGTRRLARGLGVDLGAVAGTGPGQRITDDDVLAEAEAGALYAQRGGSGGPLLVLLHGLGATSDVWAGVLEHVRREWPGAWIVPDLRGHGRSPRARRYSLAGHALDVARLVPGDLPVVIAGHSMGGAIGVLLATGWFGISPASVVAIGVKRRWTGKELGYLRSIAQARSPRYEDPAQALAAHLRFCGLTGIGDPEAIAGGAIRQDDGGWRTSFDPRAVGAVSGVVPDVADGAGRGVSMVTAVGSADTVLAQDDRAAQVAGGAVVLPGLGHNAHVEDPDAVWRLIAAAPRGE